MWTFVSVEDSTPAPESMAVDIVAKWIVQSILAEGGGTMYEIPARICPACGDLVWDDQPSVTDNGKAYHTECYRWLEARVETLTRHARKQRRGAGYQDKGGERTWVRHMLSPARRTGRWCRGP